MKKFLYLVLTMPALTALALWGWRIAHESAEPLPLMVQDMVHPPAHRSPLPPPPGVVPFRSTENELPPPCAEALFLQHCAACHGAGGDGKSFVAQQAGMPEVSDLTTTTSSPDELAHTLADGRGGMPAFGGRLSEEKRRLLLQYIETLHRP